MDKKIGVIGTGRNVSKSIKQILEGISLKVFKDDEHEKLDCLDILGTDVEETKPFVEFTPVQMESMSTFPDFHTAYDSNLKPVRNPSIGTGKLIHSKLLEGVFDATYKPEYDVECINCNGAITHEIESVLGDIRNNINRVFMIPKNVNDEIKYTHNMYNIETIDNGVGIIPSLSVRRKMDMCQLSLEDKPVYDEIVNHFLDAGEGRKAQILKKLGHTDFDGIFTLVPDDIVISPGLKLNVNLTDESIYDAMLDFDFSALYPRYMLAGKRRYNKHEIRVKNRQKLYNKLKSLGRRL